MPIREFKCPRGHITEKVLLGDKDAKTKTVECKADMPDERYVKGDVWCGMRAKRIELPSSSSILSEKTKFLSDVKG